MPSPDANTVALTASLDDWRPGAARVMVIAGLAAASPVVVAVVERDTAPWLRVLYVTCYGVVLAMALASRADYRLKAWTVIAVGYALTLVGLARMGLGGSGRIGMVTLPLLGLLLVGRNAGLLTLAFSILAYGAVTYLTVHGVLPQQPQQVTGDDWMLHGLVGLMLLTPVFVLAERALRFQEDALARARRTAGQLKAGADERRRLEFEVIAASEREQRRVGHELHDGLCQQLTGGLVAARLIERSLAGHGAPEAEQAANLAEILDAALADARSLARGLSLGPIAQGGLGTALRELARQVRETVEVDCEVIGADAPSMGGDQGTQLYRIAQEAVQNAIKHAEAHRITLDLSEDDAEVHLDIRDDGKGLPSDVAPGLGMRSMRGRATSIGGELHIESLSDGGTRVFCAVAKSAVRASES